MYKIAHITGARPHFMKLAPIFHLAKNDERLAQVIVHTGQHYDHSLFGAFLKEFDLPEPQYDLKVGSGNHTEQIGKMLIKLDQVLLEEKPDIVFVYGDTNSTAAGAIAAAKSNIALAHVEAGLREFNKNIPEEVNKLLTDSVTDLFFCPTQSGVANLQKAGVTTNVHLVGDVVLDLLVDNGKKSESPESLSVQIPDVPYYFATCHRASNTNDPERLKGVLTALAGLEKLVVLPLHPRTKSVIEGYGMTQILDSENLLVVDPIGFWNTQALIRNAECVVTDSGGIVKESYFHRTPCVIIDDQIEWMEIVNEGWAIITGANGAKIMSAVAGIKRPEVHNDVVGDGKAAKRILGITYEFLQNRSEN